MKVSFQWVPANLLLNKIQSITKTYDEYGIANLRDGSRVIFDRKNFNVLILKPFGRYDVPQLFDWFKRGLFLVEAGECKYIIDSKSAKVVIKGHEFKAPEFLAGKFDYYIVGNIKGKYAIFDKNGNRKSDWYNAIGLEGLFSRQSDYYVAVKNGKVAIFHKDGKRITKWFDWVFSDGLVEGQSDYYLVKKDGKQAIFHKDGKRLTDWYDYINVRGLVWGRTDYYIAGNNQKYAIFNKDGRQVTDWFDWIFSNGFVDGYSNYYLVKKDNKEAIFHKDGYQVTDWYDWIDLVGLVVGKSKYYVVKDNQEIYVGRLGSSKLLGPFKGFASWDDWYNYGSFFDPFSTTAIVYTLDGKEKRISKQEVEQFFEEKEINYEEEK